MIRMENPITPRLPSEYQEVTYIKSTGTEYIDTGVIANNTTKMEIKYQMYLGHYSSAFGAVGENASFFANNGLGETNADALYWYAPSTYVDLGVFSQENYNITTFDALNGVLKNYNEDTKQELTKNVKFSSNFSTLTMYLFARNNNGSVAQAHDGMTLWYAKIYDNNVLIRNFIPCYRKADNVVGLYDLINNTFYTNAGTGTFLLGEEINKRDVNIIPRFHNISTKKIYIENNVVYDYLNKINLYNYGDECSNETGGWLGYKYYTSSKAINKTDHFYLHSYRGMMITNFAIDITGYSKLNVLLTHTKRASTQYASLTIQECLTNTLDGNRARLADRDDSTKCHNTYLNVNYNNEIVTVDISSVTGNRYIAISCDDDQYQSYSMIYNVWLEK